MQQRLRNDQAEKVPEQQQAKVQEEEDEGLFLGPRILEPGVELAIRHPGVLETSNSSKNASIRHSVASMDSDVFIGEARTAVVVRATPVHVKKFTRPNLGEEMKRTEGLYRNWVPEMCSAPRM